MPDVPKCTSWHGGHKFEARYSRGPAPDLSPAHIEAIGAYLSYTSEQNLTAGPKVYELDICVRCGFVVEKKP